MKIMGYWEGNGKFQTEANTLDELVPIMGKCDTLKGEIWRAATKIYHDHYNNGFGNEWKNPAEFLMDNIHLPSRVEYVLLDHANGNMANHYDYEMNLMIDTVILRLREIDDNTPNDVDMWEYDSPKYRKFAANDWEDEDEYEYY
jgi:hypothetical protein